MVQVEWWRLAIALPAQLLMVLWLIYSAWRAAGRLTRSSETADRIVATAVLFLSSSVIVNETIGSLGLLKPAVIFTSNLLVGALGVWWGRTAPRVRIPWKQSAPRTAVTFLGLGAAGILLPQWTRALGHVPVAWDEVSYHLNKPAAWLYDGQLSRLSFPFPVSWLSYYPANGELVWTTLVGVLRNDLLVHLLNVPLILVLGIIVAQLSRLTGASRPVAWAFALVICTMPVLAGFGATGYVECVLNTSELAAILFAIRWIQSKPEHERSWAVLCGLAAGVAVGTKYSTLPVIGLLAIGTAVALLWARGPRRGLVVNGVIASMTGTATGAYWYARNALETGNPFYPVPFAGLPHAERGDLPWKGSSLLDTFQSIADRGILKKALYMGPKAHDGYISAPGISWFGVVLLIIAAFGAAFVVERIWRAYSERREETAIMALLALMMGATLFSYLKLPYWGNAGWIMSQVRFVAPFICLGTAIGVGALESQLSRWTLLVIAGLALVANLFLFHHNVGYPDLNDPTSWLISVFLLVLGAAVLRFVKQRTLLVLTGLGLYFTLVQLNLGFLELSDEKSWPIGACMLAVAVAVLWFMNSRTLLALAGLGLVFNLVQLNLTYPELTEKKSWILGACVVTLGAVLVWFDRLRWRLVPPIAIALALVMPGLLWWREQNRYKQQRTISEVHISGHRRLVDSAQYVSERYSGQQVAVTMTNIEFLYMYTGRWFDVRPIYVLTNAGTAEVYYYPDGDLRHGPNANEWKQNLRDSGAAALVIARWCPGPEPIETPWANELHLPSTTLGTTVVYDLAGLKSPPPSAAGRP